MANAKRMKSAYNLCSLSDEFTEHERDLIYFYSAVNVQLSKVINQDIIRVEIVEDFIKGVLNNDSELIKLHLDNKMNINNLSSLFSLIKMLNSNNNYKYCIFN